MEKYIPEKPLVVPVYSDDGGFSHWTLLEFETGRKLWSEDPNECKAMGYPIENHEELQDVFNEDYKHGINQIDVVKDIAEGMIEIGGVPNNQEFYAEFNFRVTTKLGIKTECKWRYVDVGMYGCNDFVYQTSCNKEYDADKTNRNEFCPNCGNTVV